MTAYTKERLLVVAFLLLFIATGHPWIWSFLIGVRNNQRVFGFPLHYFLSLVLFFVGITLTSLAWVYFESRVAEEITENGEGEASEAGSQPHGESEDTQSESRKSEQAGKAEKTRNAEDADEAEAPENADAEEAPEEAGA